MVAAAEAARAFGDSIIPTVESGKQPAVDTSLAKPPGGPGGPALHHNRAINNSTAGRTVQLGCDTPLDPAHNGVACPPTPEPYLQPGTPVGTAAPRHPDSSDRKTAPGHCHLRPGREDRTKPGAQCSQLALAKALLKRGKAKEAVAVLNTCPSQQVAADLYCTKGQCLASLGDNAGAFASFVAALARQPAHVEALVACAALQKSCGSLEEAAAGLRLAYQAAGQGNAAICEALAAVLTDLGTSRQGHQDSPGALSSYEEAISIYPTHAPAHYNLGVLYTTQGKVEQALQKYQTAIQYHERYAEAHCNMGVLHKQAGQLDDAIKAHEKAFSIAPCNDTIRRNLALACTEKGTQLKTDGDAAGAVQLYEKALALQPQHAETLYSLGVACFDAGQLDRASFFYETALAHAPRTAEVWNNLGVVQRRMRNLERAAQCYSAALQLRPNFPEALNNMGVIYTSQGRAHDAMQLLQAAVVSAPQYAEAWNTLGVLQRDLGEMEDAIASYEHCMQLAPTSRNAFQNRLLALNSVYPGELPEVCQAHTEWGASFQQQIQATLPSAIGSNRTDHDRRPDRPLVVGYVSPDFFTHSVAYFAEAPLAHHNPHRVHHIAYSCAPHPDTNTARLRGVVQAAGGVWRDVEGLDEVALAQQVRADHVDILVDLAGQTANNRLGLLAMRPAPIQVTWIGYPNSTGLEAVDYRLTDSTCDPPTTSQTFAERLVRLPGCFLAYTAPADLPPITPLPALSNGFVTFGCFNALAKITPAVVRLWASILARVPHSRLLLKNKPFACKATCTAYLQKLEAEGMDVTRVDLLPLTAGTRQHLATYNEMDVSLDPFPYTGTTTTAESLVMGVPVVTLTGRCHAHNVSASLMQAVGLQNSGWVAADAQEYADVAVAAVQDVERLAERRNCLRKHMLASRLCNGAAFVCELERTYRSMWQAWLAGSRME